MTDSTEDVSPELIWKRIGEAGRLLDLAPHRVCTLAGMSRKQVEGLRARTYLPSLTRLGALANKTGLPVEFFLSESEPDVYPARFRAGTPSSSEDEAELEQYWQRREILRLGTLGSFLAGALPESHADDVTKLRRSVQKSARGAARMIQDALAIETSTSPIGPRLEKGLDRVGVVRILYPFFTRAKIAGLGWWQGGNLPLISVGAGLSVRRGYFTTAHELAHLLLHLDPQKGVGGFRCRAAPSLGETNDPREEGEANRLAADLLMPEALKREARDRVSEGGVLKGIGDLSADWDVSRQAIALRLLHWELVSRDSIRSLFVARSGFAATKSRPAEDRFGSPDRTRQLVQRIYEAGATARYAAWLTKIPLDDVSASSAAPPHRRPSAEQGAAARAPVSDGGCARSFTRRVHWRGRRSSPSGNGNLIRTHPVRPILPG